MTSGTWTILGLDVGPPPTVLAGLTLTAMGGRDATHQFPSLFHLRGSGLQTDKLSGLGA